MTTTEKIKILFEELYTHITITQVLYEELLKAGSVSLDQTLKFTEANQVEKKISEASTKFAQGKFNEAKVLRILEEAQKRLNTEL